MFPKRKNDAGGINLLGTVLLLLILIGGGILIARQIVTVPRLEDGAYSADLRSVGDSYDGQGNLLQTGEQLRLAEAEKEGAITLTANCIAYEKIFSRTATIVPTGIDPILGIPYVVITIADMDGFLASFNPGLLQVREDAMVYTYMGGVISCTFE